MLSRSHPPTRSGTFWPGCRLAVLCPSVAGDEYVKTDEQDAGQTTGPGRSYPVPDKAHAVDAKARASQAVKAGRLSKDQASKIDAKADKVIKKSAKN